MELKDIQGLIARAHPDLPFAAYHMLQMTDADKGRAFLRDIADAITDGETRTGAFRMQLAFTWPGLQFLGADEFVKGGFLVEFMQGMAAEYRSRVLGDREDNAPEHWNWGGPNNDPLHLVLIGFAESEALLRQEYARLSAEWNAQGLAELCTLYSTPNEVQKEHFGFRDGISQPILPGLSKAGSPQNTVADGEFVLGYPNGYNQLSETPVVAPEMDPAGILPESKRYPGLRDLGMNGSYMVFRQLKQEVGGFWNQVKAAVKRERGDADTEACIQLAAKMVGRWPNGQPLVCRDLSEGEYSKADENFLYAEEDAEGLKCPFGSHIRRANPRDALPDNKPASALRISNRHRILRRGRNYGPPLVHDFDPRKMLHAPDDGKDRGLLFICFNTNIARQFEFIQHQWSNNTKFAGQYNDPDPVLGIKDDRDKSATHDFTIQAKPLRRKITGLSRQVNVVGGAYFFMPGIRAIRFLAAYTPQAH